MSVGGIRNRGKNTWQLRWELPPGADGKRQYRSQTYHGVKADAERLLRKLIAREVDEEGYIEPTEQTIKQYLTAWLSGYCATHLKPSTREGYRRKLNGYVLPEIGHMRLQQLRTDDVRGIYAKMRARGLASASIVQTHRVLHEALAHAVEDKLIRSNPSDTARPGRIERTKVVVWDDPTIGKFIKVTEGHEFRNAYLFALMTGTRRSEFCGLRWPHVDLKTGHVSIVETRQSIPGHVGWVIGGTKTERGSRRIALDSVALALLRDIKARQQAAAELAGKPWDGFGYVLLDGDGRAPDPQDVSRDFHTLVVKAKLPPLTLHGLRHCHATRLLRLGVHPKVVQERLGHSTIAMTLDTYSHVLPDQQDAVVSTPIFPEALSG